MTAEPKFSIAEVTTPHLSFADDLALYRDAGLDGIGITAKKLTDPGTDLEAFRASGLVASVCGLRLTTVLPSPRSLSPSEPGERIAAMCAALDELAPYEPACCIVGPGPVGRYDPKEARVIGVAGLVEVARHAESLGVTVAIEPIHRSIRDDFSMVNDLPDALAICDEIGMANVGVVVDVWHLCDTPNFLVDLEQQIDRVVGVQVDDRRAVTRSWADRVLPGDGIGDVAAIFSTLRRAGYSGWLDLEILSDDGDRGVPYPDSLWARDPSELVAEGLAKMRTLWHAA